jgi:hypothetical protein
MQNILTAQMQEKGRRLAQELPGFNWLEEKIRNGGVTTVLTPRRLSGTYSRSNGGSAADTYGTDMRAVSTSEAATSIPSHHVSKSAADAARSNDLVRPSSPAEFRLVGTCIQDLIKVFVSPGTLIISAGLAQAV